MLKSLLVIMMSSVLVNNYVFSRYMGFDRMFDTSKKAKKVGSFGLLVTVVMVLAALVTWPLNAFVMEPLGLNFLQTVCFVFIIAGISFLAEIVIKKCFPALYTELGNVWPLILCNSAVLGVTLSNISAGYGFGESVFSSLGCGLGFLLAMWMFGGVKDRLEIAVPPKYFKGIPILLISAFIVSLAFYGFGGIIETIFA
ncbi:MAG: electron transport complex protein RnfA [Acetatifactor sp.]|nr:electron transport complex protein RnfA [Acetatifactor sp.]